MRHDAVKVFLAVALGSFVGALVALQTQPSFWWVGLLVGGLTGYLAFDPLGVIRAVPRAWRQTVLELTAIVSAIREQSSKILWTVAGILSIALHAGLAWMLYKSGNETLILLGAFQVVFGLVAVVAILVSIRVLWDWLGGDEDKQTILFLNPVVLYLLVIPASIGYGVYKFCRNIRAIASETGELVHDLGVFIGQFAWNWFRLVHSDIRLLCGVDAAIGACIGYFTANALLGVIAGGVFGVLNFELMSKRVLKLVPARR